MISKETEDTSPTDDHFERMCHLKDLNCLILRVPFSSGLSLDEILHVCRSSRVKSNSSFQFRGALCVGDELHGTQHCVIDCYISE